MGRLVVGFLSPGGAWSSLEVLGSFSPRRGVRSFHFSSYKLGYWLNRGAVLSCAALTLLAAFAKSQWRRRIVRPRERQRAISLFIRRRLSLLFLGTPQKREAFSSLIWRSAVLRRRQKARRQAVVKKLLKVRAEARLRHFNLMLQRFLQDVEAGLRKRWKKRRRARSKRRSVRRFVAQEPVKRQ